MVTTAAIANDLHAVQSVGDMGVVGHPELLTGLTTNCSIITLHHGIAEDSFALANDGLDVVWEPEGEYLFA